MLGIRFIKFDAMTYVIHYKKGRVAREGRGLAFYYYEPSSSIAAIPLGSNDVPFIFNEQTQDYQTISVQGQVSYRVKDAKKLAEVLDFTVDAEGIYKKDESEKITQRIINEAQTSTSALVHSLTLKEAIRGAKSIEEKISAGLKNAVAVDALGLEILSVNVLAVKGTPEMERALEAETREALQQGADQAIYARRNFAVEQERKIKESELNTEIAVEEKKKQIVEKKAETELLTAENNRKLRETKIKADIAVETERQKLIDTRVQNSRKEADAQGYAIETLLKPYRSMDWKTLAAIGKEFNANSQVAMAFRLLAENAEKIGTLKITHDLLQSLTNSKDT
ncbi:MAG: membrane protease subunit, stomatin/prohibitin [Leptospiraceae bacterium]|nr:membrane protease subunit, stomatin/prohibitin [Leptospiraceae bacterium]